MHHKKAFTLVELLVVISIIGLLSSVVFSSLLSARAKARDARRKSDMKQLSIAAELYHDGAGSGSYPNTAGWFSNPGHGGLDIALVPTYISKVPDDPLNVAGTVYMYWRKDSASYVCLTGGQPERYGFYAKLENLSAMDAATISDAFDTCVKNTWGMNYKYGN